MDSDAKADNNSSASTSTSTGTNYEHEQTVSAGRTKFRETHHPLFKGVRQRGGGGGGGGGSSGGRAPARWVCELREPNKKSRLWLGTFPTAEMAARAHDVAAMALRGTDACLNFADSAWRLPVPESSGHKEIQKAAAAAAEMFRPTAAAGLEVVTTSPASAAAAAAAAAEEEDCEVGPMSMFDLMNMSKDEFGDDYCYDWDAIKEAAAAGMNMIGTSTTSWDVDYLETSTSTSNLAHHEVSLWSYSF